MQVTSSSPTSFYSSNSGDALGAGPQSMLSQTSGLPPELAMMAVMMQSHASESACERTNVDQAFERLNTLRDQIERAIERAKKAQDESGFWGEVSSVLGDDVATAAGVIASAALVVGSGGTGLTLVVAAAAVGFTAGAKIGEEAGLDPKICMGLQIAGALAGIVGAGCGSAQGAWATIATVASVFQGIATAGSGGAMVVEGHYRAESVEERGHAQYYRGQEQLVRSDADLSIQVLDRVSRRDRAVADAVSDIQNEKNAATDAVVSKIGA